MRRLVNIGLAVIGAVSLILLTSTTSSAQKLPKRIHIQATAMGTMTQMGRMFNVNLIIEEVTSDQERAGLLEAFQAKGNEGLQNALEKMHAKGRMAITGTLGYDVAYVKVFKQPDGSTIIRMVTNRLLQFGEVWASTRSRDYNLSAVEIVISKNKKYSGKLYPACWLKINKEGNVELQLYQNPWNLTNIMRR
ncbi:MAG TPA: hypothetical protein VJ372_15715 [Pyrinomonadaceae bacterium]|jgi:hypothetical protein|nr:hypothetical protein [Pyrinomonadaceae bacterium]